MRDRLNASLPVALIDQVAELAARKKITRSSIVEAALESFFSPDNAQMQEAALARRLDRLSRQVARIERDLGISAETLALFVRFWLTVTPPIAPDAYSAAQAKGRVRFEGFVDTLGKHLQSGRSFLKEIPEDAAASSADRVDN
ncbi:MULTISPECIES: ribbon-helix-helix protein, CopG family [Hyphomicrobiales]|uniref:CopG family transcriptional regulator n=3 Tax=Hyphomicrobiales TaxID=356 RepID=A0A857C8K9_9HYPH|nr:MULTISPECIES: ribbon-helix-helix protein, CopG family [Hyphomicrobiales]EXL02158.1 CopG family transcriptional regulator [Brucella anthropi]KAB2704480.1 CopG family transcriptional regulator [Brucella lupini]KAB2763202.1 CopG family transcriptional regulator [Brucella anthropi]OYR30386.1 putative helix-turn-helix protein, CopG [Brucella lupini]QGZ35237.1 CopG family transcriptional regulator [Stappia indica]